MAGIAMSLVDSALALGAVQVPEELEKLVDFVCELAPVNVMEIGSEAGGTFYCWCQLASGLKISVDLPTGASGSWKYSTPAALESRTQMMMSWALKVCVVTGDSHSPTVCRTVKDILSGQQLDFLFIDGDHSYDGVKADYETYRAFVRPGGYIAFHDIKDTEHHRVMGCDVARFWNELSGDKQEFCSEMHWGGIGLIRN